jgi:hypothetical protein
MIEMNSIAPLATAKIRMRASEPWKCHVKKVTATNAVFCSAKIMISAPSIKPIMRSMNMYIVYHGCVV